VTLDRRGVEARRDVLDLGGLPGAIGELVDLDALDFRELEGGLDVTRGRQGGRAARLRDLFEALLGEATRRCGCRGASLAGRPILVPGVRSRLERPSTPLELDRPPDGGSQRRQGSFDQLALSIAGSRCREEAERVKGISFASCAHNQMVYMRKSCKIGMLKPRR